MRIRRLALVSTLALFVGTARGGAQEMEHAAHHVTLTLSLGRGLGGPGGSLARQLRARGFDDTSPYTCFIWCWGPIDHPEIEASEGSVSAAAAVELDAHWSISAGWEFTDLGGATSYRASADGFFGTFVWSLWEERVGWLTVRRSLPHGFVGGVGPALHRIAGGDHPEVAMIRPGLTLEAGWRRPWVDRLFFDTTLRGHWIADAGAVPHEIVGSPPLMLRPAWSHLTLVGGVGVRL